MPKTPLPPLLQHAVLERRGGATAVARMLFESLHQEGVDCRYTFELAETQQGQQELVTRPWKERLLQEAKQGHLLHLHASRNWGELFAAMDAKARLAVTLHDASLLSGGCPFPLDCEHFSSGCVDPCPRGFPAATARRQKQHEELRRLSPLLLCPSRWMKEQVKRLLPGMTVQVAPNGVDWPAALPTPATARASLGVAPEAKLAMFVAHGGEDAGYKAGSRWASIWEDIKSRCPQAIAFFVGGQGHDREGDLLRWPYLEQEQLRLLLRAADVLVYPTLADNHPLLILQAMAMGCAVVASAVGGIPEQVTHGNTGLLAPAGDFNTLADNAVELLETPALARKMGEAARQEGSKRFSRERMIATHRKMYGKLAG